MAGSLSVRFQPQETEKGGRIVYKFPSDMKAAYESSPLSFVYYSDYPAQAKTREELARNVDCALYNVKLGGKHGCQRFVPGMVKKSREQLGFSQNELLKSLPGSGIICHADDHRILYANDDFVRLFDCENLEDFNRFSLGLFRNLIHPEDYERVMKERREGFAGKKDGDQIRLHFRIVTKRGSVKEVIAQARLRHHDTFGDLHFVTCMDLDEEYARHAAP